MKDADLVKLVEGIGYTEGLPVVTDPGIINPREFIDQVIKVRLPNPFMPDTPQRIAMDSSIKIPIRFGETIKAWKKEGKNCAELKFIPLVFAGWLRYLLGVDDQGNPFEVSPDPNYENLAAALSSIKLEQAGPFGSILRPILSNPVFFGINLYDAGLGEKVEELFTQMLAGSGAVRNVLTANLS
jgi:fructuronate reductase